MSIRRAFAISTVERYIGFGLNLLTTIITARLMGPAEFGVSVLGASVFSMAAGIHEFGAHSYIIQEKVLTTAKLRTAFTVSLLLTSVLAVLLFAVSDPIAQFYDVAG